MDILPEFNNHWHKALNHLTPENCGLVLAVSGGVDSIVLTNLVLRSGFDFVIAHCNFQLRGEESERDEVFVRCLAEQYNKVLLVKRFDTNAYAKEKKTSIQEAARELRYEWFAEIVNERLSTPGNKHWLIATAHHADDNIETVLMNLFRGTGLQGLAGIRYFIPEKKIVRPLLFFRKNALISYACQQGLEFVEDSSNASDKYTRNLFRNTLIPAVKEIFPGTEENILHTIARLDEAVQLYQQAVKGQLQQMMEPRGEEWHIPVLKWERATPLKTITWELLKPYGFSAAQVNEAIKLLDAANGSYLSSPTHHLIRNRKWMILTPKNDQRLAQHLMIEKEDREIGFLNGKLLFSFTGKTDPANNPSVALLDAACVPFPLILRPWKQGDYFYPLGMQKKKKLSRFFIDLKLSKTDKEKVWVLEADKKIAWVIGYRIDDRFKITGNTTTALSVSYLK